MQSFTAKLAAYAADVDTHLGALLPTMPGHSGRVCDAMRYAALGPGKRLRPFLVMSTGRMFGANETGLLRAAAAIECVHAYSLVHDDLPCMDDDDLRRGRPTVHRAFDEATAVLAGDALQTLAFEILSDTATDPDPLIRLQLVGSLARAAGAPGMVGGQMADIIAEQVTPDLSQVLTTQKLKTGALIEWCVEAGAHLGRASRDDHAHLRAFAADLGLAYQIADDILDETGDAVKMGKAARKDAAAGKVTFVALLGLDGAISKLHALRLSAKDSLVPFGSRADDLSTLVDFVLERQF